MRTMSKMCVAVSGLLACLSLVVPSRGSAETPALSPLGNLLDQCLYNRNGDACYELVVGYGNTSPISLRASTIVPLMLSSNSYKRTMSAPVAACQSTPRKACSHSNVSECLKFPSGEIWQVWQQAANGYVECCFVNCLECQSTIVGRCAPVNVSKIPERVMYQIRRSGSGF